MSMEQAICEGASYGIAYDDSDQYNSCDVNVPSLSEDDTHVDRGKESRSVIEVLDDAMAVIHELPDHTGIPLDEIPYVGLRFVSLQQAQEFYTNYAKKVGFVTRIRNTNFDKTRNDSKIPVNQSLHCSREGYRESRVKAATRVKRITTAGCKARMYVMLDRQKDNWMVSKLELKHTHPCSAKQAVHYTKYRELTMHAKCVIQNNDEAGIRPNKTYLALANEVGGSSNLGYSEKDVRNFITSNLRCADGNADVKKMISYFMRMKDINPNFFYAVDVDEANHFKSALWVDARCRASYEYYGDVVSFDTTYSRNKHGLPFASFVGVNHHGKSTLLGCALMGNEEIRCFEWVFKQWLRCMGSPPQAIITDQCKSMFGAIKNVLPDTRHRWCIWHIMKKIPHKLGGYARYKEIDDRMHGTIWNARSVESFEKDWAAFIVEFNLEQNRWLSDLYDERRMWVPIYFQGEFWAGMRSTQRSESMHAFYGGHLHCKSGLVQFVHEYDNVLGNKEQKELEDDAADSKGVVPCSSSTTIERQFQREYTTSKFREVQQEFRKKGDCLVKGAIQDGDLFRVIVKEQYMLYGEPRSWNNIVEFDPSTHKIRCECNMFASRGIICCHYLAVYFYYGVDRVPCCYVLPRWSKNVQRKHTFIKSSHDEKRSDESHNLFRRLCTHFFNVAQEFVTCEEEAAMLHSGLDELRAKLVDYRANLGSRSVPNTDNNMVTQSDPACVAIEILGPSKVATKGRPRLKRLGSELDTSIKRSMRRKKNNPHQENNQAINPNIVAVPALSTNESNGNGGFLSLLHSFRHS
ncbi:protein FAR1-RELATED SEQUENCE 6-like [Arachis stenosperma]|uniref:protein FAR1-RELATED SEQUENCE 6-like n=1 Tax=Arachis stenosperma TaxID=217475 RepID=UPI0025AD03A6|nr:protein FAR1-RELATED SEQUENCE 6-like [Arachis stenosperma]